MSVNIPWDLMAAAAAVGYFAGLITAIPLILWATRQTKEEKDARNTLRDNPDPDPGRD